MTPFVVLVGLPGSGKSVTGRRLAKMFGVPFADSDDLVEELTGRSVQRLFAEAGEALFREVEGDAVEMALQQFRGVLALGGGALTRRATRTALRASRTPVVMLRARLETLGVRIGDGRTRPLLADDPARRLAELAEARAGLYRQVASFGVDTDGRTPGQVAAIVAARLHEREVRT